MRLQYFGIYILIPVIFPIVLRVIVFLIIINSIFSLDLHQSEFQDFQDIQFYLGSSIIWPSQLCYVCYDSLRRLDDAVSMSEGPSFPQTCPYVCFLCTADFLYVIARNHTAVFVIILDASQITCNSMPSTLA